MNRNANENGEREGPGDRGTETGGAEWGIYETRRGRRV